jgi:hypothetical protein
MRPAPFSQEDMITITVKKNDIECAAHSKPSSVNAQGIITNTSANGGREPPHCRMTGIVNLPVKTYNLTA